MASIETYHPQGAQPRSAYFHVPFCRHRCGYCNFSLVANRDYLIDRYLEALAVEVAWLPERYVLDTLFLGGGTPTHLNLQQLRRLFSIVDSKFDYSNAEVTSEANPSDLVAEKVELLTELGVNRFSLGVQSFSADKLKFLERDHDADGVRRAVDLVKQHVDDFSLDLIFATREETLQGWQSDLTSAVSLQPTHLSTYELTIEKGTQFWNRERSEQPMQIGEELRAEMYEMAIDYLNIHSFSQYEVSSFAAVENRCQHNLIYWSGEPYFAFGAGASRFVDGIRETNHGSVTGYIKRIESGNSPANQTERLAPAASAIERLVIGLRRIDGVDKATFARETGYDVDQLVDEFVDELQEHDLIRSTVERIQLTRRGILLYDSVATMLLSARQNRL